MRFSHSTLLTLTTVITTSFLYQAQTAPISLDVASSPSEKNSAVAFEKLSGSALEGRSIQHIEKRCGHATKHVVAARKKSSSRKRTTKKKSTHKKKSTKKSKKKSKKKSTKKSKKKSSKKTTKKKTTKKTTKKKTSTKKKTTKKSGGGSGGSFTGDGTFYNPGLGSCGIDNNESQLIAALNAPQMKNGANPNNNPMCGKYATVTGPKGTVRVKIVDTCPPCVKGDIDLSPAAFGKIADFADGRVKITWSFS